MAKKKTKNIDHAAFAKIGRETQKFSNESPYRSREREPVYPGKSTNLGLMEWMYQILTQNEKTAAQLRLTDIQIREAMYKEFGKYTEKLIEWKRDNHKGFKRSILVYRNKFNRGTLHKDGRYPENISFSYGPSGQVLHSKRSTPEDKVLELCIRTTIHAINDSGLTDDQYIQESSHNPTRFPIRRWMIFQMDIKNKPDDQKIQIKQGGLVINTNFRGLRHINNEIIKKRKSLAKKVDSSNE